MSIGLSKISPSPNTKTIYKDSELAVPLELGVCVDICDMKKNLCAQKSLEITCSRGLVSYKRG